ncbi:glycosyltransferase [Microbacterium sp. Mcb102]|uniref:glycosyltransferase n=1 Tax=Microbacterium sp. Mcb102 TaxID=2926012 RepID=UPI0021C74048|nr:glycosyltransferase [Microbacterium sp. Mcb102]
MKVLLLFANAFPFGAWEPYLETEVEYYSSFDRVEIFSLSVRAEQRKSRRAIADSRIRVHPISFRSKAFYAIGALRVLFDGELYRETARLVRQRRLSPRRWVQLVVFLSRAHHEAGEVVKLIRRHRLVGPEDEVVLYSYRYAYQPYVADIVRRRITARSVKSVARAHGGDLYEKAASNGYIPLRARVARDVDSVHLVGQHGLRHLLGSTPEVAGRARVSMLGTVDRGLAPAPQGTYEVRIITCSSIVRVKRLDRLVEALAVSEPGQPIRWVHYGDGPLREGLEAAVATLPEHAAVEFRGEIENAKLLDVYRREPFHALVNVSESEGVPVSMMEACSFGIPIVALDVGGVAEIVEDGVNGRLLPEAVPPEELARALVDVALRSGTEGSPLRRGARAVWQQRFRADENYAGFVADIASATGPAA